MGMSSVYPWSQGDRGLLRVPEGELGTFYQHSRRGSNDHDCWEFRCSFFRFQVSGPILWTMLMILLSLCLSKMLMPVPL